MKLLTKKENFKIKSLVGKDGNKNFPYCARKENYD